MVKESRAPVQPEQLADGEVANIAEVANRMGQREILAKLAELLQKFRSREITSPQLLSLLDNFVNTARAKIIKSEE